MPQYNLTSSYRKRKQEGGVTVRGTTFHLGNKVATRKLYWRLCSPTEILMNQLPAPWKGAPLVLHVRRAVLDTNCVNCDNPILREELNASDKVRGSTVHFCLECVVPFTWRPDTVYAKTGP